MTWFDLAWDAFGILFFAGWWFALGVLAVTLCRDAFPRKREGSDSAPITK